MNRIMKAVGNVKHVKPLARPLAKAAKIANHAKDAKQPAKALSSIQQVMDGSLSPGLHQLQYLLRLGL